MENRFILSLPYSKRDYIVHVEFSHYCHDHSLAVCLTNDFDDSAESFFYSAVQEHFATISVCLADESPLEPDTFFADTNNCPWASDFLINNGIAKLTGRTGFSGFCEYPQFKLTPEWKEFAEESAE